MDGRTLMDIMQSPNFSMWAPAEQAFNTTQDKAKADLATTLGLERRANAMQPFEEASKQASTRLNNSTAALNEHTEKTKLPVEQALKLNMQKFFKESDENTQAQTRMQMQRMLQIAKMAQSNGGMLPQGINIPPEEMDRYSPTNLAKTIKYGETFFESDPKEIAARQRAAEHLKQATDVARIQGASRVEAAGTARPGSGGAKAPKSPRELLALYTYKANSTEDPNEKAQYEALADQQWQMIQQEAILKAQAPQGGKLDVVPTIATGTPTAKPQLTPQPMPKPGGSWTPPNGWK